jgi:hypothetical protein
MQKYASGSIPIDRKKTTFSFELIGRLADLWSGVVDYQTGAASVRLATRRLFRGKWLHG